MKSFLGADIVRAAVPALSAGDYIQIALKTPKGDYVDAYVSPAVLAIAIGGSGGGLTWTKAAGPPPTDGTVLTNGYKNTTNGTKYVNLAWPDTANPEWDPL